MTELLISPPWTLDPDAAEAMRRDVARTTLVAGIALEVTWGAAVDHDRYLIHTPRLVFVGARATSRVPGAALSPGGIVIHQHPLDHHAVPSDADCVAALLPEPTCGFAVANQDITRVTIMQAPRRPPAPSGGWSASWRAGRWALHLIRIG